VIDGRPAPPPDEAPQTADLSVSDDYFHTLRIPLLKGRAFTTGDNERSRPVVIVSQSFARRHFGDEEPIGRRISLQERSPMTCCSAPGAVENVWREIVGVAGDVRQANLDEAPVPTVYRPFAQIVEHDMFMVLRAASDADASRVTLELRTHLTAVDPGRDWWEPRSMSKVIRDSGSIRLRRFVLILLGSFAALAVVLAAVGIYGVASSLVGDRTKEIGVRIALGATRPVVFRQVLGEMMAVAAGGVVLGCAGALALTRLIRHMLFGVSATDGVTYFGVGLLLAGVVLLAAAIPARRAMRIDPMVALRSE
jgi:putative ABC transport system permease protein